MRGGMMRTQIPKFRLPESVLDEECNYILELEPETRFGQRVDSLKAMLDEDYDAVFVGCGAPRGRDLDIPGRAEAAANIFISASTGCQSVSFGHTTKIGKRVIVLGGGNTAMDCCRTSRRLGGERGRCGGALRLRGDEGLALGKGRCDGRGHSDPQLSWCPRNSVTTSGTLKGVLFEKVKAEYDDKGRRKLVPSGEPDVFMECDDVLVAVGQENSFPWIERDLGLEFDKWDMPKVDTETYQSTNPKVFFGGDAAFGPKNIIWAVAHGHEAAVSIDLFCHGEDVKLRPPPADHSVQPEDGHSRMVLRQ